MISENLKSDNNISREGFLDIAKGIGIILVVLGHTFGVPMRVYRLIYSFHMPLFFIISGYVYNEDKYNSFGFGKMLKLRAKRYLVPFYALAGINLLLDIFMKSVFYRTEITFDLIKTYFLGTLYCYADMRYMPNCSPIWFFMTLFMGGMVFWAMMKYLKKLRPVFALAMMGISYLLYLFVEVRLPLNLAPTGAAVFFMYLGCIFKKSDLCNRKILALAGVIGILSAFMNTSHPGMNENNYGELHWFLLGAVLISLSFLICVKLLSRYDNPVNRFLWWLGKNTVPVIGFNYFMRSFTTELYYLVPVVRTIPLHWTVSFLMVLAGCICLILIWGRAKLLFKSKRKV